MEPERAVERYLKERRPEVAESTYRNHKYALKQFVEWCNRVGLDDISELDGGHIHDFKIHRRENGEVNEVTLYNNLCTLRVFLRWLESIEVVDGNLADNMILPDPEDETRSDMISVATATEILEFLEDFEYATFRHALFALMWDTGFRLGTVRALDLDDYHSEDRFIEVVHRPEQGTPLKNKQQAERQVNLHSWVCEILDDYIKIHREETTDEYGRKPLFTTTHGRPARSTFRPHISALTRPCHYTGECPHDREITECEAYSYNYAQRCPSSVSPHAIRRSAITTWLNEGHQKELIGDRMNVSPKTIDKHYDARTEEEKRELRREKFDL